MSDMPKRPSYGQGRVYKHPRSPFYWWTYGGRRGSTGEKTRTAALAFLRAKIEEHSRGVRRSHERTTVGDLFKLVQRDYERQRRKSSVGPRLTHLCPFFAKLSAQELTGENVEAYVDSRLSEGAQGGTINRELAVLSRGYTLGLGENLVTRAPRVPRLAESKARQGFFEVHEFAEVRRELDLIYRVGAVFAYWTGLRCGEIVTIRREQIDFETNIVRLPDAKNGEPRSVPMSPDMCAELTMLPRSSEWIFPSFSDPSKHLRRELLGRAFTKAAQRAGVDRTFHDLRRTGARNMVRAGVPERVAMAIGGWKTRSVFDRYNIVSESDLQEAVRKLHDHLAAKAVEGASVTSIH